MNKIFFFIVLLIAGCKGPSTTLSFETFGIKPDTYEDATPALLKLFQKLEKRKDTTHLTITFPQGRYDFYPDSAFLREYYISNHDQDNPKKIGFALEELSNITIDGQGSDFVFHGRMIPVALIKGKNVTVKNVSIDFEVPALRQLHVLGVDKDSNEVLVEIFPRGNHRIDGNKLVALGEGYENQLDFGMVFQVDKRLTYLRRDINFNPISIKEKSQDTLVIHGWDQAAFTTHGEHFVLRSGYRPTPGIFVSESNNTTFYNVKIHYSEGMGLLAQMSEDITLDSFNVCFRGNDDPRYFTTQADATHFSACKGKIVSKNGLYESMADDAINVHGTYLRVTEIIDDRTLRAQYMHEQTWGFIWGESGDEVQFIESLKMEALGEGTHIIQSIRPVDEPNGLGMKEFEIIFSDSIPKEISGKGLFSIENLTWTPEVVFSNNIIRNNRARGALFSTPKRVVCENNIFDHTHGTAILLCGDSNGWFETGSCRDVLIRNNTFINALTANYQFTNAIISIHPEIPNLEDQQEFFHSGIVIEDNLFNTFDRPILYAKSTKDLVFRNNTVLYNNDFEPFHWNKRLFFFERVNSILIEDNKFEKGLDEVGDVDVRHSNQGAVIIKNNN